MPGLPPPLQVSPTIKFFRWCSLMAGITYGINHKRRLAKEEVGIKELEGKNKIIRDAKIVEERRIASERDIAMLAALGGPVPGESQNEEYIIE